MALEVIQFAHSIGLSLGSRPLDLLIPRSANPTSSLSPRPPNSNLHLPPYWKVKELNLAYHFEPAITVAKWGRLEILLKPAFYEGFTRDATCRQKLLFSALSDRHKADRVPDRQAGDRQDMPCSPPLRPPCRQRASAVNAPHPLGDRLWP